jgi:hypothetical protein
MKFSWLTDVLRLANVVPFGHDKHNAMAGTMHNKVQEWLNIPMSGSIAVVAIAG